MGAMLSRPDIKALVFGVVAAFFSGSHSVIVRYLTEDVHGATVAVLRLYIAVFVIFVILKANRKPLLTSGFSPALLITVLAFSANYVVFHWGLEYTGASSAMMLENTAPFFVLLITVLVLRERIRSVEALAALIALLGVFFIVRSDFSLGSNSILGDELELLAGLTWAVFLMGSCRVLNGTTDTFHRLAFLLTVLGLSALLLTPILFVYAFTLSVGDIIWIVLLGIFPTAIAYYLWYEAAAHLSAVTTSLLWTLTVIFTIVNASLFLDEPLTLDMAVGAVLIVAGVMVSKWPARSG